MVLKERVLKQLVEDLSRERVLSKQVQDYIAEHYGYGVDDLQRFFQEKVSTLEDYEIDLVFSPLFTPTLEDRTTYAAFMKEKHLSHEDVKGLIQQILNRTIYGHFLTPKRQNIPMALQDVIIERFVQRLYLERPIDLDIYQALAKKLRDEDISMALVLVRKPMWQDTWRKALLVGLLGISQPSRQFPLERIQFLTDFFRTYRPTGLDDLDRQLQSLIQSCQEDVNKVRGRGFHDAHLKELYVQNEEAHSHQLNRSAEEMIVENYTKMMISAQELRDELLKIRKSVSSEELEKMNPFAVLS